MQAGLLPAVLLLLPVLVSARPRPGATPAARRLRSARPRRYAALTRPSNSPGRCSLLLPPPWPQRLRSPAGQLDLITPCPLA